MQQISIPELYAHFQDLKSGEIILDVRTPEEYSEGRVPGSLNIDHEEIIARASELKSFTKVFVYCRSGNRVRYAAQDLISLGFKDLSCVLSGGMPDWVQKGYPVEI